MRIKILIAVLLAIVILPIAARAVDQNTLDRMKFLLQQPEGSPWGQGIYDDATLYDGLMAIHAQAVNDGDNVILEKTIWAMGETHLAVFVPTLISELPDKPVITCIALARFRRRTESMRSFRCSATRIRRSATPLLMGSES